MLVPRCCKKWRNGYKVQSTDSQEVHALVFKLASYDVRDGLELGRACGLPAPWLREMVLQAQLVAPDSLVYEVWSIAVDTPTISDLQQAARAERRKKTAYTPLEEELNDLEKVREKKERTSSIGNYEVKEYLAPGGVRADLDGMPLSPQGEQLFQVLFKVYNSLAAHNPQLTFTPELLEGSEIGLDALSQEETSALEFIEHISETRVYDRRLSWSTLAEAVIAGECLPEIAQAITFPEGNFQTWSNQDRERVKEELWAFGDSVADALSPYKCVPDLLARVIRLQKEDDMEDPNQPVYANDVGYGLEREPAFHSWLKGTSTREKSLTELRRETNLHLSELRRLRKRFLTLEQGYGEKEKFKAQHARKRVQLISELIERMSDEYLKNQDSYTGIAMRLGWSFNALRIKKQPYYAVSRSREFFYDGPGGKRPLLLGTGLAARTSVYTAHEAKDLFASLFPELTAAAGGRWKLRGNEEVQRKRYEHACYEQESKIFSAQDESLNYDGDPKEKGLRIALFAEPFTGSLVQGVYAHYDDETKSWSKPDAWPEEEIKEPYKDTVLSLDVNNYAKDRRVRLPRTMQGQIVKDRVMIEVLKPVSYNADKHYRPIQAQVLPDGRVEVELPPYPPAVVRVYYAIRESLEPRVPGNPSEDEYRAWLKKQFISLGELDHAKEKASRDLSPDLQAFCESLKTLSPLERMVRIEEHLRAIVFYDVDNGEMAYTKCYQSRAERFETMRVRMEELRRKRSGLPPTKQYAGVCVDVEEMYHSMLAFCGIHAGKVTAIKVHEATEVTTQNLHAYTYVPFPDKDGKRMMVEMDATPSLEGVMDKEVNLPTDVQVALPVGNPTLREQLEKKGALPKEKAPKLIVKKKREPAVKPPRVPEPTALTPEAGVTQELEALSSQEQILAKKLVEKLTNDERRHLMQVREVLRYSMDLKQALSERGELGWSDHERILRTVAPALRESPPLSTSPLQVSIQLVKKWKELKSDWITVFGSEPRATAALKECLNALSSRLTHLSLQAARALVNNER